VSSYHSSFTYNGKNSAKDQNLIIASFEPDTGFTDSFLSMDVVSEDYYDGTKRYTYGSKYNKTATITITVIKCDGSSFLLQDVRSNLKWLTGSRIDSWLDCYVGDKIIYSFLGRVTDVQQQKMDARTIGLAITFTSVSPWAYSPKQFVEYSLGEKMFVIDEDLLVDDDGILNNKKNETLFFVNDDGVMYNNISNDDNLFYISNDGVVYTGGILNKGDDVPCLNADENGVLYNNTPGESDEFNITNDGVIYINNIINMQIDNQSDDLYTYINLDTKYINETNYASSGNHYLSIKNKTLDEETTISAISSKEMITLSSEQFIISDVPHKIFGDGFNFVWPRLAPGVNEFTLYSSSKGTVQFAYRYPMKVGDCAMDIDVYGDCICCGDYPDNGNNNFTGTISWDNVTDTPTTIEGYGITDAYTISEVDDKLQNVDGTVNTNINEQELNDMLASVLK